MNALSVGELLRSAAKALFAQGALHAELIKLEWAEEKHRLFLLLITLLAGTVFMLCTLLSVGTLVLALSWDTQYRVLAQIVLTLCYGSGMLIAWRRFHQLAALGGHAFADSCAELGADLALIREKLGE
jgi:uncharacterized membrane protein YqjE